MRTAREREDEEEKSKDEETCFLAVRFSEPGIIPPR